MAEKRGRGRPPGAVSKAKRELAEMARDHAEAALNTLVRIATDGKSPAAARVTAASAILDRGYGKPFQESALTINDKRDATDWTRDELVAILRDARDGGGGTPAKDGRGRKPDRVH